MLRGLSGCLLTLLTEGTVVRDLGVMALVIMEGGTGCMCYLRHRTNLMLVFRTVTFDIASYIPIIHQVSVRNAGGGGERR